MPESVEGLSLQVLAMDAAKANFGIFERPFEELGRGPSSRRGVARAGRMG